MTQLLRQSTAVDVLIGPFVDITDGATAETGESPSVKLSKNGQALAAKNNATTPVHDADGYYNCELDATDTNTVGTLILTVAASASALPVRHEVQIVEEATYDFLYATSATPIADINAEVDTALGDYDGPTHAELISEINDVQTDIAGLNDPTAATIADAVWDEDATGHQTGGTFGQAIGDPGANTETIYDAVVTDAAGTNIAADIVTVDGNVDAILVDTAEIGAAGAGLTEAGGDGDHLTAINLPNQTMDITGNITGNLSGSVGSVTGNVGGSVGSVTGAINTAAGTITTLDGLDTAQDTQHSQTQTDISNLNDPTAATIADAVWDEVQTGHVTAGTFGKYLDTEVSGVGGGTAADIADAVWDEARADHVSSGSFGQRVNANISHVNNVQVDGTGATGDEWGPA